MRALHKVGLPAEAAGQGYASKGEHGCEGGHFDNELLMTASCTRTGPTSPLGFLDHVHFLFKPATKQHKKGFTIGTCTQSPCTLVGVCLFVLFVVLKECFKTYDFIYIRIHQLSPTAIRS